MRQEQSNNIGRVVFLDEVATDGHGSTFRALRVATPGDIVAGESQAGFTGNPC